jgi:hypothetical protein
MAPGDILGSVGVLSFGLWWVIFPSSVIRFYTWFHRARVVLPKASAVRLAGILWVLLVGVVLWFSFHG